MNATCVIAQPIHPVGAELLRAAGCEVVEPKSPAAFLEAIGSADALIVRDGLSADMIDEAARVSIIANHGTGTDRVDVAYASSLGIPVTCTPGANSRAVAEHALMLMLATSRQAVIADAATRRGFWGFKYQQSMFSLYGKTLGIVGFGRTGRMLCEMASRGLAMQVLVWSENTDPAQVAHAGGEYVDTLDELLTRADVVSLHRSMRPETAMTLDAAAIARMKPTAIVVNTARGGLIDEAALVDALRDGRLFGAGLDVFDKEPLPGNSRLAALSNVVLTPHVSGSSQEALHATASHCARQVLAALAGRVPADMVDPDVWARRRIGRPREMASSAS